MLVVPVDDGVYSKLEKIKNGQTSTRLLCDMSGNPFSIPAGATIDGIVVTVETRDGLTGDGEDLEVRIVKGGVLSGALIALSTLHNTGSHLGICDVPSAFFAAVAMLFVARLLDSERLGDCLLAGLFAGLAAGTKYPAGVVAIGILTQLALEDDLDEAREVAAFLAGIGLPVL